MMARLTLLCRRFKESYTLNGIEISMYYGSDGIEIVDDWIVRLKIYYTLYCYLSMEKITFCDIETLESCHNGNVTAKKMR